MHEYEILIETINPCGGASHAKREIIEAEAESPETYVQAHAPYPVMESLHTSNGDIQIITGDGTGSMVKYTFTAL